MRPFNLLIVILTFLLLLTGSGGIVCAEFSGAEMKFVQQRCLDCHGSADPAGRLDLESLGKDLTDEAIMVKWIRIHDRVKSGEMPPPDADQPTNNERTAFLKTTSAELIAADNARKGTVLRRLNAVEYENTMNDLFGTHLKLSEMLPQDGRSREFENVGDALSMSMIQLQRYLETTKIVLDTSIAATLGPPEVQTIRANYAETRGAENFLGSKWHLLNDGAVAFYQGWSYPTGMLREANTRQAGWYKIRVHGYAHQSDEPIIFSVGATTFARGLEQPTFGYFSMPPGEPTTIELTAWIENRYMVEVTPFGIYDENYDIKNKGIENYTGPGLAIHWVELEGPLVNEFPSQGHKMIFQGLDRSEVPPRNPNDRTKSWYKPKFEIKEEDLQQGVTDTLLHVAQKAFRRPVKEDQVRPYLALFEQEQESGATTEEALRVAITAIFCSPDFLYFVERPLNSGSSQLADYALANRLSYFLTRTLPDDELLAVAAEGKLTANSERLRTETERLLQSLHAQRFVKDFTDAWLNLRDIEFTMPDRLLFPEYDQFLLDSMLQETRAYFTHQLQENLPIETIVQSDFAMLNSRLADHYGINGVNGPEIRRVQLPADHVRGGYLTQGAVLKVSANGTNTSPVVRGVWVMERILGIHPPPPPPGVPGVEPDIRGASTLREILDKHRNSDNCRSCHEEIDPPGFALESFNPIGGWRDRFRSLGDGERVSLVVHGNKVRYKLGPDVDASGSLGEGKDFSGFLEFREQLTTEKEQLTKAFVTKLLTFATGREMGFSDREEISRIVQTAVVNDHGMRDLVHAVVQSEIFRNK